MNHFTKIIRIGNGPYGDVFCRITFAGGRLSITGVEGPSADGNADGASGQISESIADVQTYAPGWDKKLAMEFAALWGRWHLNDLRAGTAAQETFLRAHPETRYEKACAALTAAGLNPDNGYRYGSAWLREEVPAEVLQFLVDLPPTDKTPAWV